MVSLKGGYDRTFFASRSGATWRRSALRPCGTCRCGRALEDETMCHRQILLRLVEEIEGMGW
ncbi:MAG: hypothetical protein QOI57_2797 [Rubrobacteraceae bacterium]|nr:hypothetical protein [Rubrobacteraceae bacterium]